jgi:hypothetical protein
MARRSAGRRRVVEVAEDQHVDRMRGQLGNHGRRVVGLVNGVPVGAQPRDEKRPPVGLGGGDQQRSRLHDDHRLAGAAAALRTADRAELGGHDALCWIEKPSAGAITQPSCARAAAQCRVRPRRTSTAIQRSHPGRRSYAVFVSRGLRFL